MDPRLFQILHVLGAIVLVAMTFAAFAHPVEEQRRKVLSASGVASLITVIAGFGLAGLFKYGFPVWIIIKIVCWLGLSGIAGMVYRKPEKVPLFAGITVALVIVALTMVYFRPFGGSLPAVAE